jgi:aminoglycoside phosphotransferase (APT) family kinase protein
VTPPGSDPDALHAVLIEPQLARFRALCGLEGVPLTTSFEGWHRHAILSSDRVFLFPRDRSRVPGLRRDVAVLTALEGRGVPAPRLLGRWDDRGVSPYPFIAVSRLPGRTWSRLEATADLEAVTALVAALGAAVATWHRLERRTLPRTIPRRQNDVARALAAGMQAAAGDAARRLGLPRRTASAWLRRLEPLAGLSAVLVHGDVNEGQILVAGGEDVDGGGAGGLRLTGILDWESAHVGHPLKDFDFGEWGYGIFAWDAHFDRLHRVMWQAYAAARGRPLPPWEAVHLFYCLRWVDWFGQRPATDAWGQARLATCLDLLRRLA